MSNPLPSLMIVRSAHVLGRVWTQLEEAKVGEGVHHIQYKLGIYSPMSSHCVCNHGTTDKEYVFIMSKHSLLLIVFHLLTEMASGRIKELLCLFCKYYPFFSLILVWYLGSKISPIGSYVWKLGSELVALLGGDGTCRRFSLDGSSTLLDFEHWKPHLFLACCLLPGCGWSIIVQLPASATIPCLPYHEGLSISVEP